MKKLHVVSSDVLHLVIDPAFKQLDTLGDFFKEFSHSIMCKN